MISITLKPQPRRWIDRFRRKQTLLAIFSFRFDVHLVPDLIANLAPIVDGWASFDDRGATGVFSNEVHRRRALIAAARDAGADWILAIDPDERLEVAAALRLRRLMRTREPTAWGFNLREMYEPATYRVDGLWGRKTRIRMFQPYDPATLPDDELHGAWHPRDGRYRERHSGLNIYHLKMVSPARRLARRNLYRHLDPENRYQSIGYDYLADESDARFKTIPRGRHYLPEHRDDGGLWMADLDAAPVPPCPSAGDAEYDAASTASG